MTRLVSRLAIGLIAAGFGIGSASAQAPAGIPDYLAGLTGTTPPAPGVLPTRDVLQLNASMFPLYDAAAGTFQSNIMARHPIILALFTALIGWATYALFNATVAKTFGRTQIALSALNLTNQFDNRFTLPAAGVPYPTPFSDEIIPILKPS